MAILGCHRNVSISQTAQRRFFGIMNFLIPDILSFLLVYDSFYYVASVGPTPNMAVCCSPNTDLVRITFGMKVFWTYIAVSTIICTYGPIPKLNQSRSFHITYLEVLK